MKQENKSGASRMVQSENGNGVHNEPSRKRRSSIQNTKEYQKNVGD